jgi:O-antigen/teichoic acid export membrane protein
MSAILTSPIPEPPQAVGDQALKGSAWMIGASGAAKLVGFACQIAVAWFLSKREFGVYAIAVSLSVVMSVLRDGGLPMVLQQKGPGFDQFAGPAFWMMMAINGVTGLLIAAVAAPAARFYGIPELQGVILLFAITVPLTVFPSLISLRLSVNLRFRELGLIQVSSAFLRSGLLVYFAWAGFGARSFLLPLLITTITDTLVLWLVTRMSPWKLAPQFSLWAPLFASGRWIMLGTFAIALEISGAYFLLGKVLPSEVLGTYFFAYQLVVQLGTLIANNVYEVLFSAFVRISADPARIRAAVPRAINVVVLVGAAASLAVACIYRPLETALWHGKWSGAISPVYVLALVWPAAAGVSVLRAVQMSAGRFRQWGLVALASACMSVLGTVLGALWGGSATGAALGFGVGALLGAAFNARLALAGVGVRARAVVLAVMRPWLVLATAAVCARALGNLVHNPVADLLLSGVCFCVLGFAGLSLFAHESVTLVMKSSMKVLGRFGGQAANCGNGA